MSSPIVQPAAFSVSKVSVSAPKLLPSGGKMAYLNYGDARSLVLQTPSLPTPFGLNVFDKNGPPKYSVDLALRGYQENPKVKSLFNALNSLDEHLIDLAVKNSKLWFGKDMKREILQEFYTRTVKFGKDKEGNQTSYPPNWKVQLRRSRDGGDFECSFYDHKSKGDPNAQPLKGVPVEEMLVKKAELTSLVQCVGVWFAGGKFGISWKAIQVRLDSVPSGIRGCAFEDEEDAEFAEPAEFGSSAPAPRPAIADEDSEEEETAPAPAKAAASAAPADDDDDDDEEVAPAPVPKKTVVTKKKVVMAGKK